jgi:hypothetical protein
MFFSLVKSKEASFQPYPAWHDVQRASLLRGDIQKLLSVVVPFPDMTLFLCSVVYGEGPRHSQWAVDSMSSPAA